jgi:hypothetical protein
MTCEKYGEALIEGAATGGKLEGSLADHLEGCTRCRTTLQRERWLFAAIDDALRTKVNERPQAGFLAGVRAQISKEALPKSRWSPVWALAGGVLALALIAVAHPWARQPKQSVETGSLKAPTNRAQQASEFAQSGRGSTEDSDARGRARPYLAKQSVARRAARRQADVLVPPDEGKAFAQFVARLGRRGEVAQAFVSPAPDENGELSQIPPVEIARLQIKPLVWEKWNYARKENAEIY